VLRSNQKALHRQDTSGGLATATVSRIRSTDWQFVLREEQICFSRSPHCFTVSGILQFAICNSQFAICWRFPPGAQSRGVFDLPISNLQSAICNLQSPVPYSNSCTMILLCAVTESPVPAISTIRSPWSSSPEDRPNWVTCRSSASLSSVGASGRGMTPQ